MVLTYIGVFSLISPIGIGIGIGLTESAADEDDLQSPTVTVLQGLATGTLIYVVFFEVLEKERSKGTNGILQVRQGTENGRMAVLFNRNIDKINQNYYKG